MPEDSLQEKQVPAIPQIKDRKRMSKRMRADSSPGDTDSPKQLLDVSKRVSRRDGGSGSGLKHLVRGIPGQVSKQTLSHLNRKGYKAFFSSLSLYPDGQTVEVYTLFRKPKSLGDSEPSVE